MTAISLLLLFATMSTSNERTAETSQSFPLSEVRLTGGPWLHSFKIEQEYLLSREPERFLHNFRKNAGLEPKAPIYGGWENAGLAGHSLGHYLTACAQAYASTKDTRFRQKIEEVVRGLQECQEHRPDGLISAIPNGDAPWVQIQKGEIHSGGFDLNGMWSPWYVHHKVLVGLLDSYSLAGVKQALPVAERFADWMIALTKDLTDEQWARMLRCEYGGMNEALAELYQLTGKTRYLDLAKKFYDHPSLDPILAGEDRLAGLHSNTQIPKILGLARLADIEHLASYRKGAEFFWDTVTEHHSYVIGGNGDHEYFTPADQLDSELTSNTCETCCSYNMLKLSRKLFEWHPDPKYLDYYERTHLNDILPSQDPATGMVAYFFPLVSGGARTYSNPDDDFTCCHGTGMENHTKHQEAVYFHEGKQVLYVAQFEDTELDWKEAGIQLRQETDFPRSSKVKLTFLKAPASEFELRIRHPGWATIPFGIEVNGKNLLVSEKPSSFANVRRKWKAGDVVTFEPPMTLHTEPVLGDPSKVAFLFGPSVLAADLGLDYDPESQTPVLVTDNQPVESFIVQESSSKFVIDQAARPAKLTLRPIYDLVHNHYAVYFDQFTSDQWKVAEAEYRAEESRVKDIQARTIDVLRVGEMQPERDHNLTSERCDAREANGKGFRTPFADGFFEFELKSSKEESTTLVVTYWINGRSKRSGKIYVDGTEIADMNVVNGLPNNTFKQIEYEVPENLTEGKTQLRVRFAGSQGLSAASVSEVRLVRRKPKA